MGLAGSQGGVMVKILHLSDLHTEFGRLDLSFRNLAERENPAAIVLTGDIGRGVDAVSWAATSFPEHIPIALIPGNHEYYRAELTATLAAMRSAAEDTPNISILDRDVLALETPEGNIRILGATLWTDFCFSGASKQQHAMLIAGMKMKDFKLIGYGYGTLRPEDTLEFHRRDLAWLDEQLRLPFPGATIVATHHPASSVSRHPNFQDELYAPSFVSNLDGFILEHQPQLWLHGHTHWPVDEMVGFTRIVSRQLGYPGQFVPELDLTPIEVIASI